MNNIYIGRYSNPKRIGWAGWIEPNDRSWILFIGLDGSTQFFGKRNHITGAVV